jgi:hypothetical protein
MRYSGTEMADDKVTYFASTDYKNTHVPFGIKRADRQHHVYAVGKSGMGKSTLLENLAIQDIEHGEGVAFVDPEGQSAGKILSYVPEGRIDHCIYVNLADAEHPVAFNVLDGIDAAHHASAVAALARALKRLWADTWSAEAEELITRALSALIGVKDATLFSVAALLSDEAYRTEIAGKARDASDATFWRAYDTVRFEAPARALQAKLAALSGNATVRGMLSAPRAGFSFDDVIAKRRILIVNLARPAVGDDAASVIGSLFIARIYHASLSRSPVSPAARAALPHFYLFVDDCHAVGRGLFADIAQEAREHKLCLTLAHEHLGQLDEEAEAAVLANMGTTIAFRLNPNDAGVFSRLFKDRIPKEDLLRLGFAQVYLTLAIDGAVCPPFSAATLPPIKAPAQSHYAEIIARSRQRYSRGRDADAPAPASHAAPPAAAVLPASPAAGALHNALSSLTGAAPSAPKSAVPVPGAPPGSGAPAPGAGAGAKEVPENVLRDLFYVEPVVDSGAQTAKAG